jgi:hypothetical protein
MKTARSSGMGERRVEWRIAVSDYEAWVKAGAPGKKAAGAP